MKSAADIEACVGHRRIEIGAAVAADECFFSLCMVVWTDQNIKLFK